MIRLSVLSILILFLFAARAMGQHDDHADPAAEAELVLLREAVARYEDHANAVADGFRLFGKGGLDDPLVGQHWYHPERTKEPLDLMRPSTLLYQEIDGRLELVGIAYAYYQAADEPLPEGFTGVSDVWHVHDMTALVKAMTEKRPLLGKIAERRMERMGTGGGQSLVMLHAWPYGDNPVGPFAHYNAALPYRAAGLPVSHAEPDGEAAARGVALLQDDGCGAEVGRVNVRAGLEGEQEDELARACEEAREQVADAQAAGASPEALNGAAADAWHSLEAALEATLTPAQQQRVEILAATTRHGPAG